MPEITTTSLERAIDQGTIDLETGEFPMVLATQGEATDGNVLNIRGAKIPDSIPLQVNHANSPLQTIGSVFGIRRGTRQGLPVLRAIGKIELGGEGSQAEIRRDIALMISRGHLNAVSVRAHGDKAVPRQDLPKDHPAFVSKDEPNLMKRFGLFFERFTPVEGSIVALGADKQAVIGRSKETEGDVSQFWASFVEEEPDEPQEECSASEASTPEETPSPDVSTIDDLRSLERFLRDAGASRSEAKRVISLLKSDEETLPDPPRDVERKEESDTLVRDVQTLIRTEFTELKNEINRECQQLLNRALGRVQTP